MAFQLNSVVPWGRNLSEYRTMFNLTDAGLKQKRIAGFGDGPASFNCEATRMGASVTSFDPIYRFSEEQLRQRIQEVRPVVMRQTAENRENYVWTHIQSLEELEQVRMSAMETFLADYETGKREGRYVCHELPAPLPCEAGAFDLGLSSHFLLLYPSLGYEFHIQAISEMLRVCREVRIFPIVDLDAAQTDLTDQVIRYFRSRCELELQKTEYVFQKGDNLLLVLRNFSPAP